jgi:hypothetical protein
MLARTKSWSPTTAEPVGDALYSSSENSWESYKDFEQKSSNMSRFISFLMCRSVLQRQLVQDSAGYLRGHALDTLSICSVDQYTRLQRLDGVNLILKHLRSFQTPIPCRRLIEGWQRTMAHANPGNSYRCTQPKV